MFVHVNQLCRCVHGLFEALTQIYNDQESSTILGLTTSVAAVFAKGSRFADNVELEELKQLKADAQAGRVISGFVSSASMLPVLFRIFATSAVVATDDRFLGDNLPNSNTRSSERFTVYAMSRQNAAEINKSISYLYSATFHERLKCIAS